MLPLADYSNLPKSTLVMLVNQIPNMKRVNESEVTEEQLIDVLNKHYNYPAKKQNKWAKTKFLAIGG